MFKYSLYKSKANNASKGLWYPCIHYEEMIDTRGLAEHMASHSSAHSPAQVEGVLCDMITCIHELCAEGYKVKIPELGIFQYNIKAKGRAKKKNSTHPTTSSAFVSVSVALARCRRDAAGIWPSLVLLLYSSTKQR